MAAQGRVITIHIVNESLQEPTPTAEAVNSADEPKVDVSTDSKNKENQSGYQSRQGATAKYIVTNTLQMVSSVAKDFFSSYLRGTEDYATENLVVNAENTLNTVAGLASSIAQGAAVGGWVGAIVGAVVGVAKIGINTAKAKENAIEAVHEKDYANYFNTTRIGYVDGGRGTEN